MAWSEPLVTHSILPEPGSRHPWLLPALPEPTTPPGSPPESEEEEEEAIGTKDDWWAKKRAEGPRRETVAEMRAAAEARRAAFREKQEEKAKEEHSARMWKKYEDGRHPGGWLGPVREPLMRVDRSKYYTGMAPPP